MLFLGHTRFSLYEPDSPSWRLSRADESKDRSVYEAALFSHERLHGRGQIFFDHTLPTLDIASRGFKLIHVVSFSENLPQKYKEKLYEAQAKYGWLVLDERGTKKRGTANGLEFIRKHLEVGELFASFRLDDDDILATNFFHRAAEFVTEDNIGRVVSFGLGIQAFFQNGNFIAPRMEHRPKIAIGLLSIGKHSEKGRLQKPRSIAHTKSDIANVVILDSREIGFIHTMHGSQDSGVDKEDGDFARRFRNYLNLPEVTEENDRIQELFPTVTFNDLDVLKGEAARLVEWNFKVRTKERVQSAIRKLVSHAREWLERRGDLRKHSV